MPSLEELERFFLEHKPIKCEKCREKLVYIGSGKYECEACNYIMMDDFGKVKDYIEEHGPTSILELAAVTGVKRSLIEGFLKSGRLEIPEGSDFYISCEKCGCQIRYGRYCPECISKTSKGMKALFHEDMGERPKGYLKSNSKGKIHFFNK